MKIFQETPNFDFLGKAVIPVTLSVLLILSGLVSIVFHGGLKYGIDFRGGINVQIRFAQPVNLEEIRGIFEKIDQGGVTLQTFGNLEDNEILIALPIDSSLGQGETLTSKLKELLTPKRPDMEIRRIETIGPKVGDELKTDALKAILIAIVLIVIYISLRFQWKYAVSAIVATMHDVLVIVGVFSLLDKEFDLNIVAALLTIVGYSLNDTIVIFDRVRENIGRYRKKSLAEIVNLSINETLSRTLITSGIVFMVVVALFMLGGEIIHDFSLAMLIGVLVGSYSTFYIANPILLLLNRQPVTAKPVASTLSKDLGKPVS